MYSGGGNAGEQARTLENERQARIDQGMDRISAVYDGGMTDVAQSYVPGQTYFNQQGEVWKPELRSGAGQNWVSDAYKSAIGRGELYNSRTPTQGFGDAFYKARGDAYTQFAMPQVQTDYNRTRNKLAYSLARQGLTKSSSGNKRRAGLGQELAKTQRQVADAALGEENKLRGDVEGQRSQLVAQLNASADPDLAASEALRSSSNFRADSPFTPLGTFFEDWTRLYVGNQEARTANPNIPNFLGKTGPSNSSYLVK